MAAPLCRTGKRPCGMQKAGSGGSGRSGSRGPGRPMRNGIFMRAAGTYGPSEPGSVAGQVRCLGSHISLWSGVGTAISLFARANTASQGKESMGPASRCSPPCAKGGQHGRAMQGGIDSTQLPGRYQVPGVGMVSQVPSIPQSAFADSSLCTREPSLLPSIQPAFSVALG